MPLASLSEWRCIAVGAKPKRSPMCCRRCVLLLLPQVMPFSTGCSTSLSNFEAGENYKEVADPAVMVSFPVTTEGEHKDALLVAWTTTPWTLPSNIALCVHPTMDYVKVRTPRGAHSMPSGPLHGHLLAKAACMSASACRTQCLAAHQAYPIWHEHAWLHWLTRPSLWPADS